MLALCIIFWYGGTLKTRATRAIGEATAYPDHFAGALTVLEEGTAPQLFSSDIPESAKNCRLVDIVVNLTNMGFFDAEWISVSVEDVPGDIAVYELTGAGEDIRARSTGSIDLKLITHADESSVRTINIQYYVYGISRTIQVTV